MVTDLEFLVGILERDDPSLVTPEDFDGVHGDAVRLWQRLGFIGTDASLHPAPSCPHCFEGVPYGVGKEYLCSACSSTVEERYLFVWQFSIEPLLGWLASEWNLSGGVRQVDSCLWQLGTGGADGSVCECFFWRRGILTEPGRERLTRYRNTIILCGLSRPSLGDAIRGPVISLLEGLRLNGSLAVLGWNDLLRSGGSVRFDAHSGALWAGNSWLGEIPLGSKEYVFLRHLAVHLDYIVAYSDLKQAVLRQTRSKDTADEATFCHDLKRRIKKRVPLIDQLLVATNKGEGYRLRGHMDV